MCTLLARRGGASEQESSRRLKTQFLVELDGSGSDDGAVSSSTPAAGSVSGSSAASTVGGGAPPRSGHVLIMAATNIPQCLDDAVIRRFVKRVYVSLPNGDARKALMASLFGVGVRHSLSRADVALLVKRSEGYSGSDLAAVCREAALGPLRSLGADVAHASAASVRPVSLADFTAALAAVRPSVPKHALVELEQWNVKFGSKASPGAASTWARSGGAAASTSAAAPPQRGAPPPLARARSTGSSGGASLHQRPSPLSAFGALRLGRGASPASAAPRGANLDTVVIPEYMTLSVPPPDLPRRGRAQSARAASNGSSGPSGAGAAAGGGYFDGCRAS